MAEEKKEDLEQKENKTEETNSEKKSAKEIKLQDELLLKKQELDDLTDRYKRILAEFENFKKRSSKERESLYNSIISDIVTSLLPVVDNLEKAAEAKTEDISYKQGIELVLKQFKDVLASQGVTQIEAVGKTFDPELHEAVSSVIDENLGEKEIKEEYRKGYKIGTKVIRHSMVVVAN